MKSKLIKHIRLLLAAALSFSAVSVAALTISSARSSDDVVETNAWYNPSTHYSVSDTASKLATYYSSVQSSDTGNTLLSRLQSINSSKRGSHTVGYSTMGTSVSSTPYIYTDYDPNYTATDSNGQTYGTRILSFYTKTSVAASGGKEFNREHMWPNSHGGDNVEDDILHTRPTIESENSSRGNSFYVEGKCNSSSGWDPYTAGYEEWVRGECARVILYSVVAYSGFSLSDADSHSTSNANPDNMMGNMNTLIKWHFAYTPNEYEMNRNNGAEYLQGNRNPFVDHPEYVAKIWSNYSSTVNTLCNNNASVYSNWTPGSYSEYGTNEQPSSTPSINVSATSTSIVINGTTTLSATLKNAGSATVSWSVTSGSSYVTLPSTTTGSSITITGKAEGTATIQAKITVDGTDYIATKQITVSASAPSSSGSITYSDLATAYETVTSGTAHTSADGNIGFKTYQCANYSSKMQWKKSTNAFLYTTTSLNLSSITINGASGGTLTVYGGSTAGSKGTTISGSNNTYNLTGYNYFYIENGTSSAANATSISITTGSSSSTPTANISGTTSVVIGNTTELTATLSNVTDKDKITWTSSDTTKATVAKGTTSTSSSKATVTGVAAGSATIYCKYDGTTIGQTTVTVNAKTLSSITVKTAPTKTSYTADEYFDPSGLVITCTYNDSSTADVTYSSGNSSDFTFSPSTSTALTTSDTSVSITYGGKSCNQAITVTSSGGSSTEGSTATFVAGTDKGSGSVTKNGITVSMSTMDRTDNYRTNSGTSMTVTSTVGNMTKIEITCTGSGTSNYSPSKFSGSGYTYSGNKGTWVGSAESVTLSASAQVRMTQIDVTYESSGSTTSYTISYNANGGSGTMPSTTGTNPAVAACTFTRDGYSFSSWNTSADGSGTSYAVGATPGKDLSLYAIWVAASEKSSMQIAYEACAALSVGGSTTSTYTFTGTIAATQGNSFFVQDGDYGLMVYGGKTSYATSSNVGYQVTVKATLQNYGGCYETKAISSVEISSSTGTVTPKTVTSYDSISSLSQSILSNLSSGVVKSVPTSAATDDMSFEITVGGQDITIFGSRHNSNASDLHTTVTGLSVGDYISISNMETSVNNSIMQLALTEQTVIGNGYTLDAFCAEFLGNITCDVSGTSGPTFVSGYSWSTFQTLYTTKLESADRTTLKNAQYTKSGSGSSTIVTPESGVSQDVAEVVAKYDYIVGKYGTSSYADFMTRNPAPIGGARIMLGLFEDTTTSIIAIVSVSMISITSVGAFFALRKRKEQ